MSLKPPRSVGAFPNCIYLKIKNLMLILYSLIAVIILCLAHIFVHKLKLTNLPRHKWLSVAGGISVAYIFLEAFPELHEIQQELNHSERFNIGSVAEMEVYLLSLIGLTVFYGLENISKKSKQSKRESNGEEKKNIKIFWIHIFSFTLYNFIIGYLLLNREEQGLLSILLYTVAMSFHFVVTDHALESHYSRNYQKYGRWLLVCAIFLGWLSSTLFSIPEFFIGILFSFLAGGIIMNVLKEELPSERESNLPAFCLGIFGYGTILVLIH